MKLIKNPNWIEGKQGMDYRKRILMENEAMQVNLIEEVVIPAGGYVPEHAHDRTTEAFYMTKGRARMKANGEEFDVGPSQMVLVEAGETHSFRNDSEEDFEMLILKINFEKDDAVLYEVKK